MKATITIQDSNDEVDVRVEFDPPVSQDTETTAAGHLAAVAFEAVAAELRRMANSAAVDELSQPREDGP